MEWMLMPFRRYAEFSGRSRRKEFWMFQLLALGVALLVYGLMIAILLWKPHGLFGRTTAR